MEKTKKKVKKQKGNKYFKFIVFELLLIPALTVLYVIGLNSNYLIRKPVFYIILLLLIISFIIIFISVIKFTKNKSKNKRKLKKGAKIFLLILYAIYFIGCNGFLIILYGKDDRFRTWLITTAMQTMNHQYLCKWFYNDDIITSVMNNNVVIESGESTDASLVHKHEYKYRKDSYENDYERQILDVDDDIKYQIIDLDVNGCKGYLAVVYDPSKVKLAVTEYKGYSGEYVTEMARKKNALLAINGGGFSDPGNMSTGGTPTGATISYGKIITNGEYGVRTQGGGIIGFTNDDVLVLLKTTDARAALNQGVRDAITWGPFLIVNGQASFIRGNGGWGYAARSAIGQRADGIVLLLVIDANATRTRGADMVDLTEIMQNYGAINAANLDGGTSSVMVLPRDIAIKEHNATCHDYYSDSYCNINNPIDGALRKQTRPIADAWVVEN